MKIRLAGPINVDSIVDGPGLRVVIWTQGCVHDCLDCHNPGTHDINGGLESDTEEVKKKIAELKLQKGITISGGEPFLQPQACAEIAEFAHLRGMDVWCFTGFLFEDLIKQGDSRNLLKHVDVLIDGPFILAQRSLELKFRGSKNQRLIDVKESLKCGKVVEYKI